MPVSITALLDRLTRHCDIVASADTDVVGDTTRNGLSVADQGRAAHCVALTTNAPRSVEIPPTGVVAAKPAPILVVVPLASEPIAAVSIEAPRRLDGTEVEVSPGGDGRASVWGISIAPAFAKTAKECTAEWRADKAGMQARGVTEKAYVEQCKGGAAPAASTSPPQPTAATSASASDWGLG